MPPLCLLLVRHGQSAANRDGRMQGRLDTPLTAAGMCQAEATADRLAAHAPVDALYSSPLSRALETARIIGNPIGIAPVLLDDLIEIDLGVATGLRRDEARQRWKPPLDSLYHTALKPRWPGGESLRHLTQRAARAVDGLRARHPSGKVIVVSHKVTLRWMLAHLLSNTGQMPAYAFDHCAITEVILGDVEPFLACANDRSHLAGCDENLADCSSVNLPVC
jgi:2,3-bisphosphoglycerate-dependent phosphoglycerate mutase